MRAPANPDLMPKHTIQIEELIIKYARGRRLSRQEMAELRDWQARSQDHGDLPEKFRDLDWLRENLRRLENVPTDRMWDFIRDRIALDIRNEPLRTPGHLRRLKQWTPIVAAGLVLVAGWLGYRYYSHRHPTGSELPELASASSPIPGKYQVLLTLAGDSVFALDHVPNGKLAETKDFIVYKTDSDRVEFALRPGAKAIRSLITTGHSRPFHVVFPDGSKAILSYGSRLSTSFKEGQRELALTGEAFFEAAKDPHQPFTVLTTTGKVEVLGTRFNVSSDEDESGSSVSLLSGAVRVEQGGESRLLKPLQQTYVRNGRLEVRTMVDTSNVLRWASADPVFKFENADLNTVIRRIARWHQVKIYNPDNVVGVPITGIFRQKESLEAILGQIDRVEHGYAFLKRKGDTIQVSAAVATR
jgi:transmembrane sensor